jgi:endonuclease-3
MPWIPLAEVIEQLEAFYSVPDAPEVTNPWEMILWENVAYLANDRHRQEAMEALRTQVGSSPVQILAMLAGQLLQGAVRGLVPEQSVEKVRDSAKIALEKFGGNLRSILKMPLDQATKALKQFPAIGNPGAEKILLFCCAFPILALDSNGLRVLLRLGFGEEKSNCSVTYRLVREAIQEEMIKEYRWLIRVHQLLCCHGQELCKQLKPHCTECPLVRKCP